MKGVLKSKRTWMIIGVIIVLSFVYNIGSNSAKVQLNDKKVSYDQLEKKISSAKKELKDYNKKINDLNAQYKEKQDEFNKAKALADKKDDLEKQIDESKAKLDQIKDDISSAQDELAKLQGTIKEKKSAPIKLSAGQFTVGNDVPAGRYKAVPIGEGSNFVVFDLDGKPVVNTILGSDSLSVPSYVFKCEDGYVIETHAPVKLIPLEE